MAARSWRGDHKSSADERAQSHCDSNKTGFVSEEGVIMWKIE